MYVGSSTGASPTSGIVVSVPLTAATTLPSAGSEQAAAEVKTKRSGSVETKKVTPRRSRRKVASASTRIAVREQVASTLLLRDADSVFTFLDGRKL